MTDQETQTEGSTEEVPKTKEATISGEPTLIDALCSIAEQHATGGKAPLVAVWYALHADGQGTIAAPSDPQSLYEIGGKLQWAGIVQGLNQTRASILSTQPAKKPQILHANAPVPKTKGV